MKDLNWGSIAHWANGDVWPRRENIDAFIKAVGYPHGPAALAKFAEAWLAKHDIIHPSDINYDIDMSHAELGRLTGRSRAAIHAMRKRRHEEE